MLHHRGMLWAMVAGLSWVACARADDVTLSIHADSPGHPVSPYLTGACIEDVNHEIYGGIYSQMIFGESFQEPPAMPLRDCESFGGQWQVQQGELQFQGIPGDKLICSHTRCADGAAGVDVWLSDADSHNVGLLFRVAKAGWGVDHFDGYEFALNARDQRIILGRHRHNWEPRQEFPCQLPTNTWIPIRVEFTGRQLRLFVNGQHVGDYEDDAQALIEGVIGLRAFQPAARYRNLWVESGQGRQPIEFLANPHVNISRHWQPYQTGSAQAHYAIDRERPWVGQQSQRMTFAEGQGEVGLENRGLNRWGLHVEGGRPYEGELWARCTQPLQLTAKLENHDGSLVLAERTLTLPAGDWQKLTFELTPARTQSGARFCLALRQAGTVELGYVFLQPGAWGRYQGLTVRRDVAEALVDQGLTVLRYGGSMINHPEYRWKKMIGPRDRRPPYAGTWYPYSTNGWGILDFLDLCEAAHFLAIPAFNMDETPADLGHFVEYVNGPATSEWGRRRADAGHPQPYNLRHLQLGNEERIDAKYAAKFRPLAAEIWRRDPQMTIVVGDFSYGQPIDNPDQFGGSAAGITSLDGHREILQWAKAHQREVWFDVHIDTNGPLPNFGGTFSLIDALNRIADGAAHRVVIFEFNAGNHSQRRALANAAAINAVERDGRLPIALSANCLQPDKQNDNDWNQGLLFLDPAHVWLQPPGYVTQMVARAYQPRSVPCELSAPVAGFDVAAKKSDDGRRLMLQAVNATATPQTMRLSITGFQPPSDRVHVTELVGELTAVNSAEQPQAIAPTEREWTNGLHQGQTAYTFPSHSVTILRWE